MPFVGSDRLNQLNIGWIFGLSGDDDFADPSGGFSAAIDALPVGAVPGSDTGQRSLFGAVPADPDGVGELVVDGPRGPGRPPGAKNKSTDEWSRYILSRYRSPLIALAEIASATPAKLADELSRTLTKDKRVSELQALEMIVKAAEKLAPYLHQKQPIALDGGGAGLLQIVIGDVGGGQLGEARILPMEEYDENQGVSGTLPDLSESDGRKQ